MRRRRRRAQSPATRAEFAHAVPDLETWAALQHTAGAALPGSEVVKVVVDRRAASGRDATAYFLDTVRYPTHVDFCRTLDPRVDAGFDTIMYRDPDRPFVLATLTRLRREDSQDPAGDLWWLELWPGDNLEVAAIADLVDLIRGACFFGDGLRFKAASGDQHDRLTHASPEAIERVGPLLDQGAIYRGLRYQGLTLGTAHGRLRILRAGEDLAARLADLTPYDVVVSETIPLEIGPVSGLITAEHQTPLAHVAVLSENRGSPNCAVIGAHDRPDVLALEGAWVRLEVKRSGFALEPCDEQEARQAVETRLSAMRRSAPRLHADSTRRALIDLTERRSADASVVGAKSAALARLGRRRTLRPFGVPGFTVPVAHYVAHVEHPQIRAALDDLARLARGEGVAPTAEVLERVRTAIEAAPVEPGLVAEVRARIERWRAETAPLFAGFDDVVFRSSSNCEDLPGFNGAGLADSYRAGAPITDDLVADRLRQVWASLWSDRGYAERAAFGIDQSDAAMAVLVQPVVPHAAHVVAITTNTVKPGAIDAYFLNLLPSGSLVTDADSDTAEQLLLFDDDPACAEVLCFAGGRDASLLPDALLGPVRDMLKTLDRRVRHEAHGACRAADVEFLVLDQPHGAGVVLLQARPWGAADARR